MVLIPAGKFTMGSTKPKMNINHPAHQHEVTLTQPFYLSIYEVTNEQYKEFMGKPAGYGEAHPADAPVHTITWEQGIKFCEKLTELPASKAEGKIYRLPTEAEWEYACRAGSTTDYYFGDSKEKLGEYAWYMDNIRDGKTAPNARPVGQKKPNAWGLYDMHGNVNEFCQDIFGPYAAEAVVDPRGPKDGYSRVVRGGTWGSPATNCLSAYREEMPGASNLTGFRVAMSLANQTAPSKSVHQISLADFDQSSKLDHQPHGGPLLEMRKLDYAALRESFFSIGAMLANGADPNEKNAAGTPILFYAIEDAKREVQDVRSNWNIEDQSRAFSKQPKIERNPPTPTRLLALLKAGADPNAQDEKGRSPLNHALKAGEITTVELLYQFGADATQADTSGLTPLELSTKRYRGADAAACAFLKLPHPSPQVGKRPETPLLLRKPDQQLGSTLYRPASGGVAITYSGDGKHIISGQTEHVLRVFDATTGTRVSVIHTSFDYRSNHYIWSLTSIPKSRIVLASGGIGYPLRFWNIDTGIEVMRLDCKCVQASVSPDGKYLFTGDYLCQIKSTEPLKLAATAREFRGSANQKIQVRSSFFTPDSRYLILVDDEYGIAFGYGTWRRINRWAMPQVVCMAVCLTLTILSFRQMAKRLPLAALMEPLECGT